MNDSFSTKLLVHLRVVLQQDLHDLAERQVMRHPGGVGGVLAGVAVGGIGGHLGGDVIANALGDPVGVGEQRAELLVEGVEDVAEAVQLGFGPASGRVSRNGLNLGLLVCQSDLLPCNSQ